MAAWTIIREEPGWVAVDKPAGLLSIPDRYDRSLPNLHDQLTARYGKVHPVHRLDRETSGIILFARTAEANLFLSRQFEAHQVVKTYLALVRGCPGLAADVPRKDEAGGVSPEEPGAAGGPGAAEGVVDAPIGEHPGRLGKMRVDQRHGRPAQTAWRVIERLGPFSLVEARPLTGRQHQVRVHLAWLGCPLAIDPVYGGGGALGLSEIKPGYKRKKGEGVRPLIDRLTLHAARLRFLPPGAGEPVELAADLPRDFTVVLKQLRRWAPGASPG
ncbi:MAG: RluA family pseudouridine synthase [Candidatus Riflebacteria bacterium]|nr:RluA family pseudouridine synthase [Candidatus Riflebacteria bacterium]